MAKTSVGNELAKLINKLREERAALVAALQQIDTLCDQLGISKDTIAQAPAAVKVSKGRRGRPAKADKTKPAKKGRRTRGKFTKTGEESVFEVLQANGALTSAQVNEYWSKEGRGGRADNTLNKLLKAGKIKRIPSPDGNKRGSRYSVA
jgi:hypothetical protein